MVRLLLVEDYSLFRGALAMMLDRQPDLEVAAQCGSPAESAAPSEKTSPT
jgi:two-component system response regulator DesR